MAIDLPNPRADLLERYRPIVPDWEAFIEALSRPLPLCLWTNTLRCSPETVRGWLDSEGIDANPVAWTPIAFKGPPSDVAGQCLPFAAGLYHIQEEVSCLPVALLNPRPGERVIDVCAAPGSKSAQTAVAMRNGGTLISNDRDGLRHRATRGTLDRLGVVNTTITIEDATHFPAEAGLFDRVLADVPCTCEGTSRKNYAAFLGAGREVSERMSARQQAILERAVALCRPGGRIVYATCTYAPEENEVVVDAVLHAFGKDLDLLPARIDSFTSSAGLTSWLGRDLDPRLEGAMRVWPHQNDSGGFFVAVLEKRAESSSVDEEHAADLAPPEGLDEDVASEWGDLLIDRFGFSESVFDHLRLLRPSKKHVSAVASDHQLGVRPPAVSTGMPLIRAQLEYPKLTTAGSMLLGPAATKNVIDVSEEQAAAYTAREEFVLSNGQGEAITDTGYVLIRRNDVTLGVALCYLDERRVLSMYPKRLKNVLTS